MTARPGRWDLLDRDSDPVPGDVLVVQRLAGVYAQTGNAIGESADKLRRLAGLDGWTGKAAEKFAEAADDVAGDLAKAKQRYSDAGEALGRFVTPLDAARDESWQALTDAVNADEDIARSSGDLLEGIEDPTPEQMTAQRRRSAAHDEATGRLQAATSRLHSALEDLEAAAETCARSIRAAAAHYKDSGWDNFKGALRDFADWAHLDVIVKVLTVIAIAIAAIAIVVALIATAPLWLATALFVGAMVVGGLLLAANTTMALSEHPSGSWTYVVLDVFGLLTLGYGRYLTGVARGTATFERTGVALAAGNSARTAAAARLSSTRLARSQVANAMKMAPGNPLRVWAERQRALWAAQAAQAGDDAARAVNAQALPGLRAEIGRLLALPGLTPEATQSLQHALRQAQIGTVAGHASEGAVGISGVDLAVRWSNGSMNISASSSGS